MLPLIVRHLSDQITIFVSDSRGYEEPSAHQSNLKKWLLAVVEHDPVAGKHDKLC